MADTWESLVKKVVNSKDSPIRKIMKSEAKKLKDCIQFYLDIYYSTYTTDNASGNLQKSLRADNFVSLEADGKLSIKVYFDEDLAWGKSWLDGYDGALKPFIIEHGFKKKSNENYMFSGFKGYDFIAQGIKKYESETKYNLKVLFTEPTNTNDIWR